jgi:cobalamin biosynthesis protein CobD/CbiB
MTRAGADPLLSLVAGLAIDAVLGDMPAIFRHVDHPVVLAGRAIAFFDRKLNRETRSEASRRDRGIITVILLVGAAAALGFTIERLCHAACTSMSPSSPRRSMPAAWPPAARRCDTSSAAIQ